MDGVREFPSLTGEIRDALPGLLLEIGGQLVFKKVLNLRPEPTQIYFQFADRLLHLRLQQQSGQLEQPSRLRLLRRDIARIETQLSQREKQTEAK